MAAASRYGVSLKQLRELMEHRGREGVDRVSSSSFLFQYSTNSTLLWYVHKHGEYLGHSTYYINVGISDRGFQITHGLFW